MKKDIIKKLKEMAEKLPVNMELKPGEITGKELMKDGRKRDGANRKIDPKATYVGMQMQQANHFNKLKKIYKQGGFPAVQTYCVNAVKKNSEQNKQARERTVEML